MKPKLLLYCTKAKKQLFFDKIKQMFMFGLNGKNDKFNSLNGKIVAECDFDVEEIKWEDFPKYTNDGKVETFYMYATWKCPQDYILEHSCLTFEQLDNYLGGNNGYAINIKNLHILDNPKKLTDYHCKTNKKDELCLNGGCGYKFFYKAPQNMMKVYDHWGKGDEYILISIKPQWLCKILNGEKTIEVRKKVLKEML